MKNYNFKGFYDLNPCYIADYIGISLHVHF